MVSYELGSNCASGIFWVVEPGDTLYLIARETGFSVEEILQINPGIIPENLLVGTKICLPAGALGQTE